MAHQGLTERYDATRPDDGGPLCDQGEYSVVSVFSWVRRADSGSQAASRRFRFDSGLIDAPFTLERVIFGFIVRKRFANGGVEIPPLGSGMRAGLLLLDSAAGTPDVDPATSPDLDWLWVGLFMVRDVETAGHLQDDHDRGWWTPEEQLETVTRRTITSSSDHRLWLVTTPIPPATPEVTPFAGTAQLNVLVSRQV